MIDPNGPLPPEIYWRRRLAAIGGAVVVVGVIIGVIVWSSGGGGKPANTAAHSSAVSSTAYAPKPAASAPSSPEASAGYGGYGSSGASGASPAPGAPPPNGPVPASGAAPGPVPASGLCPDSNISVVLYTDKPTYKTGDQPVFTIVVTNAGLTECTRDVGKAAQNVVVRSLDGTRTLWSARDCSPLQTVDNRTLKPRDQVRETITWSGTTSNPGCNKPRNPVPPGAYQAFGKIGEKESAPLTFNVVAPAQRP